MKLTVFICGVVWMASPGIGATVQDAGELSTIPEDAIRIVCLPQLFVARLHYDKPQVEYRLATARNPGPDAPYTPYRFDVADSPAWRSLLADESASIYGRMCAARFLLELNDGDARAFIERQLEAPDLKHAYNAAAALIRYVGSDGSKTWAVQKIIELIDDERFLIFPSGYFGTDLTRFPEGDEHDGELSPIGQLCDVLGAIRSSAAVPALIRALEENPWLDAAASALGDIGDTRAGPPLLKCLKMRSGREREETIALGKLRYRPAVPTLLERLREMIEPATRKWGSVVAIMEALIRIDDKSAIPELRRWLARSDVGHKSTARRALAHLEYDDPVPVLLDLLNAEADPSDHYPLMRDLGAFKDIRVVKAMERLAKNSAVSLERGYAIRCLGQQESRAAVRVLIDLLEVDFSIADEDLNRTMFWRGLRYQARLQLGKATGQDLPPNAEVWREWFEAAP